MRILNSGFPFANFIIFAFMAAAFSPASIDFSYSFTDVLG